jgi:exopolysaccharide biosynthesis predicted pyruvyltransferase EpsI
LNPTKINDNLIKTLLEFSNREVTALLNRGNRGDGVIHMGGRQLFAQLGLKVREVREQDAESCSGGDVLLVFGGGAFGRGTHTLARLIPKLTSRYRQVVLLPASFDLGAGAVRRFAQSWGPTYTVCCRELVSFDSVRKIGARPRALLLAHDLAFHADMAPWASRPHTGMIGIFRRDNEASFSALPTGLQNHDASHGTDLEPEKLLDYVANFSVVHTDRCHAAITAAMMGREVHFYRNNYFKNEAIYDQSLSHYPNIKFVRTSKFSIRQFIRATYWSRVRPLEMKVRSGIFGQRHKAA